MKRPRMSVRTRIAAAAVAAVPADVGLLATAGPRQPTSPAAGSASGRRPQPGGTRGYEKVSDDGHGR